MHLHLSWLASPLATLAVFAAGYFSPSVRRRRQLRHAADERLLGRAPVFGADGDPDHPIIPGVKSLAAQVDDIEHTVLKAALLNGKGEQVAADVAWLRKTLSRHLTDPEAHQ